MTTETLEEEAAEALVDDVMAESFEEEKENWIQRMAHELVADAVEDVEREAEHEYEVGLCKCVCGTTKDFCSDIAWLHGCTRLIQLIHSLKAPGFNP
jgi:hypothetical protein